MPTVTWKVTDVDPPAGMSARLKVSPGGGPAAKLHGAEHEPGTNVVPSGIWSVTTTLVAGTELSGLETVSV